MERGKSKLLMMLLAVQECIDANEDLLLIKDIAEGIDPNDDEAVSRVKETIQQHRERIDNAREIIEDIDI